MAKPQRRQPSPRRQAPSLRDDAGDARHESREPFWSNPRRLGALVVLVTLVCFAPAVTAEFTNWDDPGTIAYNPRLNPPSISNWLWHWHPRHPHMDLYVPVTYTVWSALAAVAYVPEADPAGVHLNPWVFHGANVAIHALSALAAFALLRRLVRHNAAAAAGALLYALHPVQVESVAWASGTKDLLFGLLSLVALWQYVKYAEPERDDSEEEHADARRRRVHYALATLAFVLAMLAKPTAVVLPAVAAVLDLLLLRRSLRQVVIGVAPWLLLAVPVMIEARSVQPATAAEHTQVRQVPLPMRPLIAADALGFYLQKLVFPVRLGPLYDRAPATVLQQKWYLYTWLAPAAAAAGALAFLRRAPWAAAALAVFVLGVAPVLGLVPFDFQAFSTVSDHYLYLSMLGPALALSFGSSALCRRSGEGAAPSQSRPRRPLIAAAVWLLLTVLGLRSFFQSFYWNDSVTLFSHAVRVNPNSPVAYTHLATALEDTGQLAAAVAAYEAAARLDPFSSVTGMNLARVLARIGDLDRAEAIYREVLASHPGEKAAKVELEQLIGSRAEKATTRAAEGPGRK